MREMGMKMTKEMCWSENCCFHMCCENTDGK